MRPLPEAVQRAFPREAHDLPERPWWYKSREGRNGADCYRRNDDPHTPVFNAEVVAAHDAAHPLPHPGYRAGQVWADDAGDSVVVTCARGGWVWLSEGDDGWSPSQFAKAYPYLMADPACPHLAPWSPAEVRA
jgi:hypothetical protein